MKFVLIELYALWHPEPQQNISAFEKWKWKLYGPFLELDFDFP